MRAATNNYGLIIEENEVVGISLGYDFTAEHEGGIRTLKDLLNTKEINFEKQKKKINKKSLGIEARRIKSTEHLYTGEFSYNKEKYYYFLIAQIYGLIEGNRISNFVKKSMSSQLESMIEKEGVATAWSDSDLCFVVKDKIIVDHFKTEMERSNLLIGTFGSTNPFSNNSLTLLRETGVPQEIKDELLRVDVESIELMKVDDATGIKKELEEKQNQWHQEHPHSFDSPWNYIALRPHFTEKRSLMYWLNPSNQKLVNFGWYTVEQLREWLNEEPNEIVSEENWPKLKFFCRHTNIHSLIYSYKEFFLGIKPDCMLDNCNKKIIRNTPKYYNEDFNKIIAHILFLYTRDLKEQIDYRGKTIEELDSPRREVDERVFGICESFVLLGMGYFGACNTPCEKENFSWLREVLRLQAWFLIAKEKDFITSEEEEKFLKYCILIN
jgi:hypothetical protein